MPVPPVETALNWVSRERHRLRFKYFDRELDFVSRFYAV